jgi:hypothetical protein
LGYYPELTLEDCRYFRSASRHAWAHNDRWIYAHGEDIHTVFEKTNCLWDFVDERPPREIAEKLSAREISLFKKIARIDKSCSRRREKNVGRQETF